MMTIAQAAGVAAALMISFAVNTEVSAISSHPLLLTTPAGIELARKRVKEEQWARDILDRLAKHAGPLENDKLPVFESNWWREARKKPWQETYKEVNHHTMFAVVEPVTEARDAAIAYAATGDRNYAALARKVLLHYAGYDFFAVHPDVGLNWSVWCLQLLQSYDLVYDTLSPADRAKLDGFFKRALDAVMRNDEWWMRDKLGGMFNNHFAWHKLFVGSYGLFYGKPELVDYAMETDNGIRELIENGSRDDGLWLESSLNYHFTAVVALAMFAGELANTGSPLEMWNRRFANGRGLKDLITGPIQTAFPDETIPTIGDTYGRRMRLGDVEVYFAAYDAYQAPELAWILRDRKQLPAIALFLKSLPGSTATAPPMKTRLWPEHGYAALRTEEGPDYWKGNGYSAFVSYDLDGIHSHRDKFDLMIFGRGAHLAVDPEAVSTAEHAFSSRVQNELNRSTVCHNTVMVDGRDQNPIGRKLDLVEFVNTPEIKLVTIADTAGMVYPGVRMSRTVAATDDFVLDVFQVRSDKEHTYDYLLHSCDDEGSFRVEGDLKVVKLGSKPPWSWLRNARGKSVDDDWSAAFRQGGLSGRFTMLGEPTTRLITCEFPKNERCERPSVPMLIARRKAKSTVFVGLLQAEHGELPPARLSISDDRHGLIRIKVDCGGEREILVRKIP